MPAYASEGIGSDPMYMYFYSRLVEDDTLITLIRNPTVVSFALVVNSGVR